MLNKLNKYSSADEIISALDSIGAKKTILHSEIAEDCSIHDICIRYKDEVRMFKAYDPYGKEKYVIHIFVDTHWNEQTWPNLIEIRRRSIQELGYELMLIDLDMWQLTHKNHKYSSFGNKINTIRKICKKYDISLVYITCTDDSSIGFIKEDIYHELNKKQYKGYNKLIKYFRKHIKKHFEFFTYYCDDNLTQVKYDNLFKKNIIINYVQRNEQEPT